MALSAHPHRTLRQGPRSQRKKEGGGSTANETGAQRFSSLAVLFHFKKKIASKVGHNVGNHPGRACLQFPGRRSERFVGLVLSDHVFLLLILLPLGSVHLVDDGTDAGQPGHHGASKEYAEANETQEDVVLLVQLGQAAGVQLYLGCRQLPGTEGFGCVAGDVVSICREKSNGMVLSPVSKALVSRSAARKRTEQFAKLENFATLHSLLPPQPRKNQRVTPLPNHSCRNDFCGGVSMGKYRWSDYGTATNCYSSLLFQ